MKRGLVVAIDDFGLHAGVNTAALELARAGRVSAISAMTGAPHWEQGAPALRELAREPVDIGLHLDLTEHPLGAPRRSLPGLIATCYSRRLETVALRDEMQRQFDAFERGLGRRPDHVDGHQHVHQLPQVRDALVQWLDAVPATERPWLRYTGRPAGPVGQAGAPRPPVGSGLKPWVIETLGAAATHRLAQAHGLAMNRHLLGVYGFSPDPAVYEAHLQAWLAQADAGDLLMCHASVPCEEVRDPLIAARANEYRALRGPRFAELLAVAGLSVARLRDIVPPPAPAPHPRG